MCVSVPERVCVCVAACVRARVSIMELNGIFTDVLEKVSLFTCLAGWLAICLAAGWLAGWWSGGGEVRGMCVWGGMGACVCALLSGLAGAHAQTHNAEP